VPRYEYMCLECKSTLTIAHASDDKIAECPKCHSPNSLKRALSRVASHTRKNSKVSVGDVTEDFIHDSREELKQQKKELLKKT